MSLRCLVTVFWLMNRFSNPRRSGRFSGLGTWRWCHFGANVQSSWAISKQFNQSRCLRTSNGQTLDRISPRWKSCWAFWLRRYTLSFLNDRSCERCWQHLNLALSTKLFSSRYFSRQHCSLSNSSLLCHFLSWGLVWLISYLLRTRNAIFVDCSISSRGSSQRYVTKHYFELDFW